MAKRQKTGIELAVEAAGGQRPLAAATKIAKSHIHRMFHSGVVPPSSCKKIEAATGIPKSKLNPEMFGAD
jgi:DNA-binding transcriptional regulator YdaS (Cro superfamily)